MRLVLIVCTLVFALSLAHAAREVEAQKSDVTKLQAVDLGEARDGSGPFDVQRKRDSGQSYNRPNRLVPGPRFRSQANRLRSHQSASSRIPAAQPIRPFVRYGPPSHSTTDITATGYQRQRDKSRHQSPFSPNDSGLIRQEVPSPIRNLDFAEANPIASQNNEPFGMHTANYLPPRNQEPPGYASTDDFASHGQVRGTGAHSQDLLAQPPNHQISDAALFLSENAQAIRQLYGAPASDRDFAPGYYDRPQNTGDQIQSPAAGQFGNLESTSHSPQEFHSTLPAYASGTLDARETLEQIQSLEKDRLIAQLQRALVQARTTTPSAAAPDGYAQDQASYVQGQDLLASINQLMKTRVSTTPPSLGNAAFSRPTFLPGTTVDPLGLFPLNYGAPTTVQTPITTTTTTTTATGGAPTAAAAAPSRPPQPSGGDAANRPASSNPIGPPARIPIYGGFVPTFVAGTNFVPSYSTSVFDQVRPVQPALGSSPTHFGIPIPTDSPQRPTPSGPTTMTPAVPPSGRPDVASTPAITPVALPPIRPVATPVVHPVVAAAFPAIPASPAQVHPVQATPAVTQPTYGLQTALINPVLYKPVKAVYPVYYYPNVAYQLQKPALLPSYPWGYAPSYAQTKPAQIWK